MHRYNLRPGHGSKELLIEIVPEAADRAFFECLLGELSGLGVRVGEIQDVWMNDEVLLHCESQLGSFLVTKDIWGFVFVLAPDNQPVIAAIAESLGRSGKFHRET